MAKIVYLYIYDIYAAALLYLYLFLFVFTMEYGQVYMSCFVANVYTAKMSKKDKKRVLVKSLTIFIMI